MFKKDKRKGIGYPILIHLLLVDREGLEPATR